MRLFLAAAQGGGGLTTTMQDVAKVFSLRHLLNLVLVDADGRRYFKSQEIFISHPSPLHQSSGADRKKRDVQGELMKWLPALLSIPHKPDDFLA